MSFDGAKLRFFYEISNKDYYAFSAVIVCFFLFLSIK